MKVSFNAPSRPLVACKQDSPESCDCLASTVLLLLQFAIAIAVYRVAKNLPHQVHQSSILLPRSLNLCVPPSLQSVSSPPALRIGSRG